MEGTLTDMTLSPWTTKQFRLLRGYDMFWLQFEMVFSHPEIVRTRNDLWIYHHKPWK